MENYKDLKSQYTEYISLNQLYQICRISKRSARYLVQNGIIPCVDNGNQTWRYTIALDDVITYLNRREQEGSMIPRGAVNNPIQYRKYYYKPKQAYIMTASENKVKAYFASLFKNDPDMLFVADVAAMTGLHKSSILKHIKANTLKAIPYNRIYLVPKSSLLDFVITQDYLKCGSPSDIFKKNIQGFEKRKTKK